ncbi:hypothetical protein [Bacillus sp. ISL-37]|uniref:hypothetical protein n=1 Tax=Bacillus sp. ISL-37 TaxID=2819123 RepID=UPI001BEBE9C6|nr:hypothetical protein [Bacillus sp. ISL-37]MBT2683324.1 hypothetical protein [Bacillus sp. ISL-37]
MKIKNRPPQHLADDFFAYLVLRAQLLSPFFAFMEEKVILNIVIYSLISENLAC